MFRAIMIVTGALMLVLFSPSMILAQGGTVNDAATKHAGKITETAIAHRHAIRFDGEDFSGPGWTRLLAEGRDAQFFLIGEEHGIAENPKLAAALFSELVESGYSGIVVETSPFMAEKLDFAARGGLDEIRNLYSEAGGEPAFFGMQEEAEFIARTRAAVATDSSLFWGVDYEVLSDRQLLRRLTEKDKPAAAQRALERLHAASRASWERYQETRGPQYIFSFAGDPQLVQDLRENWPDRDREATRILTTLEETLTINRLFMSGQNWPSNQRRADLIRSNFLSNWNAAKFNGQTPKLMVKMGASHLVRGRSYSEAYDLGALLPEIAAVEGAKAFSILVLPGTGSKTAVFNPAKFSFDPAPAKDGYAKGLAPVLAAALQDEFTLIDLRALRPVLRSGAMRADQNLARAVLGFDMLLIMAGSTPSGELQHD